MFVNRFDILILKIIFLKYKKIILIYLKKTFQKLINITFSSNLKCIAGWVRSLGFP